MSRSELYGFLALVRRSEPLQVQLRQCAAPWAIVELAQSHSYFISYNDLHFGVTELDGACDHWPWSGLGSQARRRFCLDDAHLA